MDDGAIKLLYDVTVFGHAQQERWQRTGVFRVVDEMARRLAHSAECDLSFCCAVYPDATGLASSYVAGDEVLRRGKMLGSAVAPLRRLRKRVQTVRRCGELVSRGVNKILSQAEELAGVGRSQIARFDVFHAPAFFLPPVVDRVGKTKKFLTVYDLVAILQPELCREGTREFVEDALKSLLPDRFAICISEATKQDLCNQLPSFPPERAFVTHLAASEMFYPCNDPARQKAARMRYQIPDEPYFLALSTLEPRKNFDHLVRCFAQVTHDRGFKDTNLVLVGEKGWKYEALIGEIAKNEIGSEHVILAGYVADEDLAPLYSGALGFVYPSLYEGFGLPPLEAMQCGTPVITSNTSSLPEVVGDAGIMISPRDSDALAHAMLELANNANLRQGFSQRGLERAKQFSWAKCATRTIAAYRTALAS